MLSDAQLVTLKAAIDAETDPTFVTYRTEGNNAMMTEWFNQPSTFVVWRSEVPEKEILEETSSEATDFDWTIFMGTGVTEIEGWKRIFLDGSTDMSKLNIRNAMSEIFAGPQNAPMVTHVLAIGKRNATVGEELFTTGTGTQADPATMDFEGAITLDDIRKAVRL